MDGVCIDSSVIGNNVTISQNTVIGKNGFGFHLDSPNSQIFFHIGGVKIGNDVFIGSNSSLVAPLTLEEGSTIGAGSVITKKVKRKSLALTRSLQTEVKNYKRKRK